MKLESLDLNQTVQGLFDMLVRLIGEDIEVKLDLGPDLWTVQADEGTLEQVVTNIVVNARDAMAEGGLLEILTRNAEVEEAECEGDSEAQAGRFVELMIRDTGQGMDAEKMKRIFEPFYTTKGPTRGTGLGLSVAYGIVKEHGGWVRVESEPGKGSLFRVYLPAREGLSPKGRITERISLRSKEGEGRKVLLVEDEDAVRAFALEALSAADYDVTTAIDAKTALERFEAAAGGFDLVFSDVVLPDQNGLELAQTLRERRPQLPILLTSGYTEHKSKWTDIRDKGFPFLQKPYRLAELLKAVQETMKRS
jgi:CheY-like chemotaxis protein